jgi:hypothetical protein
MACDNGAILPTSPAPTIGQWFLHTPTGRKILMQYSGTAWTPIYAFGATTMYVSTTGTDDASHGTGTGTDAFLTLIYALSMVPPQCSGNVIIYKGEGTFAEDIIVQGKLCTGPYSLTIQGTLTLLLSAAMDSGVQGANATVGSVTDTGAFAATVATTVDATSAAAQKVLNVTSTTGFAVGDVVLVNSGGARQELITVASIQAGVSLTAVYNLQYEHTGVQADAVAQCQYAGKQIEVGSDIRVIDWHTANTVYIAGYFSAAISGTYTIYDYGTILGASSTTASLRISSPCMPVVAKCCKFVGLVSAAYLVSLTLNNNEFGAEVNTSINVNYCYFNNCRANYLNGYGTITSCFIKNVTLTSQAIAIWRVASVNVRSGTVISGYSVGIYLNGLAYSNSNDNYLFIRCCTLGLSVSGLSSAVSMVNLQYTNCATNSTADAATFGLIS